MSSTPISPESTKAVRRALAKKIIVNISVGLIVTVGSTLIVNALERKFVPETEEITEL